MTHTESRFDIDSRPIHSAVMSDSPAEGILRYHEQTKHHPDRYARSPGYMDWDNQPNPFRVYEGAPIVNLPALQRTRRADISRCMSPTGPAPR